MARDATEKGNDDGFVERDEEKTVESREDSDASRWDEEVIAEFSVHGCGLSDEEGGELSEGDGESNG